MKINPCVIAYLPDPAWGCTTPFYENVTAFEARYPLLFFTAHPKWAEIPGITKLKAFPDVLKNAKYPNGEPNPWAVNNAVFWTAVRIVAEKGFTHMIYLEVDCRVRGDFWDKLIVDEYLQAGEGKLMAGSALTYSPCNRDLKFALRWRDFLCRHAYHKFPIPSFGGGGAAEKFEQIVMINGALGVYDMEFLKSLVDLNNTVKHACETTAWDYYIGRKLVERYGEEAFNYLVHLDCIYSGYGNRFFTEEERIKLLTDGAVVGIHQCKSNWTITKEKLSDGVIAQRLEQPSRPTYSVDSWQDTGSNPVHPTTQTAETENPSVSIFIVTHQKDFEWLNYCLASIDKFATGFKEVVIMVPNGDHNYMHFNKDLFYVIKTFDQAASPLGHLHHEIIKCRADEYCSDADLILHCDSDMLFTEPFSPAVYLYEGKPVILIKSWRKIEEEKQTSFFWKEPTNRALGFQTDFEGMQRLPMVYRRSLYSEARKHLEAVHRVPFNDYVLRQNPTFPYGFCEYNFLTNFALRHSPELYHWIDVGNNPHPHNPAFQRWSHGPIDRPQKVWHEGRLVEINPAEQNKHVLGC